MLVADAVVIGGGFYGVAIAIYLVKQRGLKHVFLVESEPDVLKRASYNNQARVHGGYHYPRNFTTAYRSRVNLPNFIRDWSDAVKQDFISLYAIALRNSKVTAKQFERFCLEIDAKIQPASSSIKALFEPRLIESVFMVEEYAFDATRLAMMAKKELNECGVQLKFNTHVTAITNNQNDTLNILACSDKRIEELISCRYVFNCTYSGLNKFKGDFQMISVDLKHEITEMALIKTPSVFHDFGITVMDGPFFSIMPFPSRNLHTMSHVRYTPHLSWIDQQYIDPYEKMANYGRMTRVDRMLRDVERYLPGMRKSKYIDSLFEVKTTLLKNENDDGRPILFEKHSELPGCYSILGGKIDNVYDIFEKLNHQSLV